MLIKEVCPAVTSNPSYELVTGFSSGTSPSLARKPFCQGYPLILIARRESVPLLKEKIKAIHLTLKQENVGDHAGA